MDTADPLGLGLVQDSMYDLPSVMVILHLYFSVLTQVLCPTVLEISA